MEKLKLYDKCYVTLTLGEAKDIATLLASYGIEAQTYEQRERAKETSINLMEVIKGKPQN